MKAISTKKLNELREKQPEVMLIFRNSDFYEMYGEDAVKAAEILEITLNDVGGLQMVGFPCHALDSYLPKLIRAGHRTAFVDKEALYEAEEAEEEAKQEAEPIQEEEATEEPADDTQEEEEQEEDSEEEEEEEQEEPEVLLARVQTNSKELLQKLSVLEKAIPAHASLAICETIRLTLADKYCRLSTADTSGIYTTAVLRSAYSGEDCSVCIPARGLSKVVKTLNGQNLEVEIHSRHIVLRYVGGEISIETKPSKDFPTFPDKSALEGESMRIAEVSKDWLKAAVKRALPNIGNDEVRVVMNGIHFAADGSKLDVIATDGRKLAVTSKEYGKTLEGTITKPCAEMLLALIDQVQEVTFGKYIGLHSADYDLYYIQNAEGMKYPNYRAVIPNEDDAHVVNIQKSDIVSVLQRIATFADGVKAASIRVELSSMELRSYRADLFGAQIRDRIFVNSDIKEAVIFDVSSELLLSMLSDIDTDKVNLKVINPQRPIIISGDGESSEIVRLCMPIATNGEAYND